MFRTLSMSLTILVLSCAAGVARGQQAQLPPSIAQSQGMGGVPITVGDPIQREQARAVNLQRQEEVRRDTEKMLLLTAELKDDLQKNGQSVMSLEALKKAELIEKLAHSVKSKMKQLY